jgi:hypothetical protein
MKNLSFLKNFFYVILVPCYVILSGCSDNMVNPKLTNYNIQGKIIDDYGAGIGNKKIEIIQYSQSQFIKSGSDGSFYLSGSVKPYTINVFNDNQTMVSFCGVNNLSPKLPLDIIQSPIYNSNITVVIPTLTSGQSAYAIYFDDGGLYTGQCHLYNGLSSCDLEVRWNGSANTTGKIALFISDNSINNTYSKYGEKPIRISSGTSSRIVFNDIDLGTVPSSANISGNINLQSGFSYTNYIISLNRNSFGNLYAYGYTLINFPYNSGNSINVTVPVLPGNIFTYYLNFSGSNNDGTYISKTTKLNTSFNNITVSQIPELVSPKDNQENVNYKTLFSVSKIQPKGIYKINFSYVKNNSYKNVYLYTSSESFYFPESNDTNFVMPPNTEVSWRVTKITGFNNIDEFTASSLIESPKFVEQISTNSRKFKTFK